MISREAARGGGAIELFCYGSQQAMIMVQIVRFTWNRVNVIPLGVWKHSYPISQVRFILSNPTLEGTTSELVLASTIPMQGYSNLITQTSLCRNFDFSLRSIPRIDLESQIDSK